MKEISKENSVERVTMEDCKVKFSGSGKTIYALGGQRKMSKSLMYKIRSKTSRLLRGYGDKSLLITSSKKKILR